MEKDQSMTLVYDINCRIERACAETELEVREDTIQEVRKAILELTTYEDVKLYLEGLI